MKNLYRVGDCVTIMDRAEAYAIGIESIGGEIIVDGIGIPAKRLEAVDAVKPYEVISVGITLDGVELKGLDGFWPKAMVKKVYDGRVLHHSTLPREHIGTDEDDADLFAFAKISSAKPIAQLNLILGGRCFGKVELVLAKEAMRLVNGRTGAPVRTLKAYREAKGCGLLGAHAYLQAVVTPTGMADKPAGVAEANLVLDLRFDSIEQAWHAFCQQRTVLEALRICSLYAA